MLLRTEPTPKKEADDDGPKRGLLDPKSDIIAKSWLPRFINEPFVVALLSTFSFIFLQGKTIKLTSNDFFNH